MAKIKLDIVGDDSNLSRVFKHASRSANTFQKDINHVSTHAHRTLGGIGKSLAFATGGALASLGVGSFLKTSISAAIEAGVVHKQLAAQFHAAGMSLGDYSKQIENANLKLSGLSGFTKDELDASFTALFRNTGKVGKSLKLTALSADVARGRHMDLAKAAILVGKVAAGNVSILKRYGLQVDKVTTATDATNKRIDEFKAAHKTLTPAMNEQIRLWKANAKQQDLNATGLRGVSFLTGKFAGQAKAGATAQDRFHAALHNTEVTIGQAMLPTLNRYLNRASAWLSKSQNQKRIQHDVNQTLRTARTVIHGVSAVLGPLVNVLKHVNHLLGGTKHSAELLTGAFIAFKLRGVASLVGGVGTAIKALAKLTLAEEAAAGAGGVGGKAGKLAKFGKLAPLALGSELAVPLAGFAALAYASREHGRIKITGHTASGQNTGLVTSDTRGMKAGTRVVLTPRGPMPVSALGGGGDLHIHHLHVNARNADDLIAQLQRKAKRNAPGRRGRHGGTSLGIG